MHEPQSKFVQTNGIRMHYLDWGGSGPTCLMLHGAGMCGGSWEPMVKRIGHRLHCITPDLRNHGDTERTDVPISWDLLAGDAEGLIKSLDLRNALIVAHSYGGGTMLTASARMPERFAGAYYVEPTLVAQLSRSPEEQEQNKALRQGVRKKRSVFESRQAMFDAIKGRGILRIVTDEALWAYVNYGTRVRPDGSVELKCPPDAEAALFEAQPQPGVWEMLAKITYPITVVYSESRYNDRGINPQLVSVLDRFVKTVPAKLEITPGGHNTIMEYPDLHAKLILDFVDRLQHEGRMPAK